MYLENNYIVPLNHQNPRHFDFLVSRNFAVCKNYHETILGLKIVVITKDKVRWKQSE